MKLILMRHGESEGNVKEGFISGRSDPARLTLKGTVQVIRTAWELCDEHIDHVYVSPVIRAQDSACILQLFSKSEIQTLDWLTELDHGIFEGNYWWEVIHKIPASWRSKREDFRTPYPQGESLEMLINRVWTGLNNLIQSLDENSTCILVSHQAVITSMRFCLEHGDPSQIKSVKQIKDLLAFIHSARLSNAGYYEVLLSGKKFESLKEKFEFKPLQAEINTAAFYAKGILQEEIVIKKLETASENDVYQIKNDKEHLLKVVQNTQGEASLRQARIYKYLNEKKFPVPYIEYFDNSHGFFDSDVFIQDFLEGDESKLCSHDHPKEISILFQEIYKVIDKIHHLPPEEVQEFWRPPVDKQFLSWRNFMHYHINLTLHTIQDTIFTPDTEKHIVDTLNDLKTYILSDQYELVPIHGDLASGNIITYHRNGVCHLRRIIDFEWARMGDALWDFAYYWGWLERENEIVADLWKDTLIKHNSIDFEPLNRFKTLFHAWSVRDMIDYKDNPIRHRRGQRSKEILERSDI